MRMKLITIDEKQLKDYLVLVQKMKELTPEKAAAQAEKMACSKNKAEKRVIYRGLVGAQLKNVVHIASRYRGAGVTFAVLIAAGNRALISYIKNLDASGAANFMESCCWHIEGAVMDCVVEARKK
jgi:DNA-directed RNA polymerase sigma subunit (sigma70/sigma32)